MIDTNKASQEQLKTCMNIGCQVSGLTNQEVCYRCGSPVQQGNWVFQPTPTVAEGSEELRVVITHQLMELTGKVPGRFAVGVLEKSINNFIQTNYTSRSTAIPKEEVERALLYEIAADLYEIADTAEKPAQVWKRHRKYLDRLAKLGLGTTGENK